MKNKFAKYTKPNNLNFNEDTYKGDAYPCYAWAAYVASVEIDLNTIVNVTGIQLTGLLNSPLITAWSNVDPDVTNIWTEVNKDVSNNWTEVDKAA